MTTSATGRPASVAALNVATGGVLYDCRKSHAGKDVLASSSPSTLHVPPDLTSLSMSCSTTLSAHMGRR